jgi:hypothetical protein
MGTGEIDGCRGRLMGGGDEGGRKRVGERV